MVSRDTLVTAFFVVLAVVLWLAAGRFTETVWIRWAILLGVGVAIPQILTRRR